MPEEQPADGGESTAVAGDVAGLDAEPRRTPDESTVGLSSSAEPPPDPTGDADFPHLKMGESLAGRFTVLRFIASGGMGAVYEANDVMLRTRVALKVIRGRIATDATAMERFRREVLLARRVGHPNVCHVYELYEATTAAGVPIHFLTMELLEGETLTSLLGREGSLTTADAFPLVRQMCEGLAAAHTEGIIHRDFKSSNVMLVPRPAASNELTTDSTRVVITDFGVARAVDLVGEERKEGLVTGQAGIIGTPAYMAPEQVTGSEVTPAADIYALGAVMYEMVTGKLPFAADTPLASAARRLNEAPPRPELTAPGLDKRWAATIMRCLAREPDRRFRSARDIIPSLDRTTRRSPSLLALSAGVLVLLLGGFAFVRYGPFLRLREPARTSAQAKPRPTVAILGFRNEVPSQKLNWLPTAVSELLGRELAAAETSLRVIPGDRVARVRRSLGLVLPTGNSAVEHPKGEAGGGVVEKQLISLEDQVSYEESRRRMQALLAANVLIYGGLAPTETGSESTRVTVHMLDAASGRELIALEEDIGANGAQLPDAVISIGAQLRKVLDISLSQDEEAALSASRVKSLEATQTYAQGVMSLRKFEYTDARSLFEAALAVDSSSLDAQRRLVETWELQGDRKQAREASQRIRARPSGLTARQIAEVDAQLLTLGPEAEKGAAARMALFDATPDDVEMAIDMALPRWDWVPPRTQLALVRRLRQLPVPASTDLRFDIVEADAVHSLAETSRALELVKKVTAVARKLGAKSELAWALREQGEVLEDAGRGVEALTSYLDAERLFAEVGDLDVLADTKVRKGILLQVMGHSRSALTASDEAAGLYRRLGERMRLPRLLFGSALVRLEGLGETDLARRRIDEGRLELEALGEPLDSVYFLVQALMAMNDSDLQALRNFTRALRAAPFGPGFLSEAVALGFEASALREQDHSYEARESLTRAAMLEEQRGYRPQSAGFGTAICQLDCDQGKSADGLACLAKYPLAPEMGAGRDSWTLLLEATCKYVGNDLPGAEAAAQKALSNAEQFEFFSNRILSSVLLMRIAAARGETAKAVRTLRAHLAEVEQKHTKALAFEVALALGEVELKAARPEGRTRLLSLEREAKSRDFLRIARLAREALDANAASASSHRH